MAELIESDSKRCGFARSKPGRRVHSAREKRPAVFLDRDGTITEEVGYVNHVSRVRLLPAAARAIRLLNQHGVPAIVVTNQSGVAREYFDERLVHRVHERIQGLLRQRGAHLDKIYYCPHHPTAGKSPYRKDCSCRKPKPGMLRRAAKELAIDLTRSYVVGDRMKDVSFAHAAGLKGILVLTGYGLGEYEHQRRRWEEQPDFIARDLSQAVRWILADMGLMRRGLGVRD
jgi:D-glycero-D-manno-heptose 1,7-bisphosphate phosphatase